MLCSREPLLGPEENKQRHMVNNTMMMSVDINALVVILVVIRVKSAGMSKARAPADDLSIVTPTIGES